MTAVCWGGVNQQPERCHLCLCRSREGPAGGEQSAALFLPFKQKSTKLSSDSRPSSSVGIAGLPLLFSRKAESVAVMPAQGDRGDMAAFGTSSRFPLLVTAKVTFATTEDMHKMKLICLC